MQADVKTLDNEAAGSIELADAIFGLEPRRDILHRVVTWQLAKRRAGTHNAKERAEIRGSSAKIWRQKGTGRARHGNKKAPQFRGGGVAFGPKPRDHGFDLPKKVRRLGLMNALSAKRAAGELIVVDAATLSAPKTKDLIGRLAKLELDDALIIDGMAVDENLARAARNVPKIDVLPSQGANVYDILRRKQLVLTKAAVAALEARLG